MNTSVRRFVGKEWGWDAVGLVLAVLASYGAVLCCILVFTFHY